MIRAAMDAFPKTFDDNARAQLEILDGHERGRINEAPGLLAKAFHKLRCRALWPRRLGMAPRFVFAMTLAKLLLEFLRYQIDGRVKVRLSVFGEQIRSGHGQSHRTFELFVGCLRSVVFQDHARVDRKAIQALQLGNAGLHMGFERFGKGNVVGIEDQIHKPGCIRHTSAKYGRASVP